MKKLYFVLPLLFAGFFVQAQLNVTFAVDMNGVTDFDPSSDIVTIGGDFQGWTPGGEEMTDPDGNGVYSYTYEGMINAGQPLLFKFVINNWNGSCETCNNEFHPDTPGEPGDCTVDDGAGNINRSEMIPSDAMGTYDMPVYVYNSCNISTSPISNAEEQVSTITGVTVRPNPATDVALITFDNPTNTAHDIALVTLTGQTVAAYPSVTGTNIELDVNSLAAGVYFVTFRNELGEVGAERLIVQH